MTEEKPPVSPPSEEVSRVTRLVVGKGKTLRPGESEEWTKEYYELEAVITDDREIEVAKAFMEGLIQGWLAARPPSAPAPKVETEVDPKEIAEAQWTRYDKGKGEWAFSDKLPKLKAALLRSDKRLEFEGHTYRLQGAEDKFVARYPKKK